MRGESHELRQPAALLVRSFFALASHFKATTVAAIQWLPARPQTYREEYNKGKKPSFYLDTHS